MFLASVDVFCQQIRVAKAKKNAATWQVAIASSGHLACFEGDVLVVATDGVQIIPDPACKRLKAFGCLSFCIAIFRNLGSAERSADEKSFEEEPRQILAESSERLEKSDVLAAHCD